MMNWYFNAERIDTERRQSKDHLTSMRQRGMGDISYNCGRTFKCIALLPLNSIPTVLHLSCSRPIKKLNKCMTLIQNNCTSFMIPNLMENAFCC